MRKKLLFIWQLLSETLNHYLDDNVLRLGAALSFYTILSLPPLLMLLTTALTAFFGEQVVRGEIDHTIIELFGETAASIIKQITGKVLEQRTSVGLTIVGLVSAIFSATGVFVELQEAFNTIWRVRAKGGTGNAVVKFLKSRFVSITIIIMLALVIILGIITSALLTFFGEYMAKFLTTSSQNILAISNFLISYGLFAVVFSAIFKFIPDVMLKWRHVWLGGVITTMLFGLGRYLIGLYLSQSNITGAYGVAGSLVVLLLWIFYSSQIMFFGAEFTKVWNDKRGEVIKPRYYATKIVMKEIVIEEGKVGKRRSKKLLKQLRQKLKKENT